MERIMAIEKIISERLDAARREFKQLDRKYREAIMIGYFDLATDYHRQQFATEKVIDELVAVKKQIAEVYGGGDKE